MPGFKQIINMFLKEKPKRTVTMPRAGEKRLSVIDRRCAKIMRATQRWTNNEIAEMFGVSASTISVAARFPLNKPHKAYRLKREANNANL